MSGRRKRRKGKRPAPWGEPQAAPGAGFLPAPAQDRLTRHWESHVAASAAGR